MAGEGEPHVDPRQIDRARPGRTRGSRRRGRKASSPPSFLLTLTDPVRHWELVEALDTEFGAEPVTVRTIHGEGPGWRINAGKAVAAAVLRQTDNGAQCYNVDVRRDQRYLAEHHLIPCTGPGAWRK